MKDQKINILEVKRRKLCEFKSWGKKSDMVIDKTGGKKQEKCINNAQSVFISLEIPLNLPECGQL